MQLGFDDAHEIEEIAACKRRNSFASSWYSTRVADIFGQMPSSSMTADFEHVANDGSLNLLVGNEAGEIILVPDSRNAMTQAVHLAQYPDPIYDLCWNADDNEMAIAVADNHVYVRQFPTLTTRACLGHHDGNIFTVRYRPNHPHMLCTGGKDGRIALWDLRTTGTNSARNQPVTVIEEAHGLRSSALLKSSPSSGVTSFEFLPLEDHLLVSIGQPDYSIRFWDCRYVWKRGICAIPTDEIAPPQSGRRERAFLSLNVDSIGSRLFAVSSNNRIYSYLTSNCCRDPLQIYEAEGFRTSGFFCIFSAISPDDRYIACGTAEPYAFVFPTEGPREGAAFRLGESHLELSTVAWSKRGNGTLANPQALFVGGLDHVARLWRDGRTCRHDSSMYIFPETILPSSFPLSNQPFKSATSSSMLMTLSTSINTTLDPWPTRIQKEPVTPPPTTPGRLPFRNLSSQMNISPNALPHMRREKRHTILDYFGHQPVTGQKKRAFGNGGMVGDQLGEKRIDSYYCM